MIALATMSLLVARPARADFDVCNDGEKVHVAMVWAAQEVSVISQPYSIDGWVNLAPGECKRLASGNVSTHQFWLHAEAKGMTLTSDYATNGSGDDKQFCISDNKFTDERSHPPYDASACEPDERLATFPIWSHNPMYRDLEVRLHPDSVRDRVPQQANSRGEYMPSLFGALVIDKNRKAWGRYLEDSAEDSSRKALSDCRGASTAPETCKVRLEFADQCAIMLFGDKDEVLLFTGNHQSEEQQTREWAMRRCQARGNTRCEESMMMCSTIEAQVVQRKKNQDEMTEKVLTGMGKALEEIFRK